MRKALMIAALAVLVSPAAHGQAPAGASSSLAGTWQGALTFGTNSFRFGLVVANGSAGGYTANLVNIEQGGNIPVQTITVNGAAVHMDIPAMRGSYDGTLDAAGQQITGTLTQNMPQPLTFRRVDKLDPTPTFDAAAAAEVTALINTYFHSFTANDWDTFRSCLEVPWTAMGGANTNVVNSLDDVVKNYQNIHNNLDGTDYAVSRAAEMKITPLSPTAALVDIHWRRDKKDGSLFQEAAEILMVAKTNGAWKIHGNIARQLSQYGKSF